MALALKASFGDATYLALCLWHFADTLWSRLKAGGLADSVAQQVMAAYWLLSRLRPLPDNVKEFVGVATWMMKTCNVEKDDRTKLARELQRALL